MFLDKRLYYTIEMFESRIHVMGDAVDAQESIPQIIVADDDPSIVHLIKEDLGMMGYKVICAYDGQMAVRLAHQYHPDLIVLDVNMPMTSGFKAFEFLRSAPDTAKIPVIFITGEMSKDIFPTIADAPRVAYVKKPFDLDSFNSLISEFLLAYPNT